MGQVSTDFAATSAIAPHFAYQAKLSRVDRRGKGGRIAGNYLTSNYLPYLALPFHPRVHLLLHTPPLTVDLPNPYSMPSPPCLTNGGTLLPQPDGPIQISGDTPNSFSSSTISSPAYTSLALAFSTLLVAIDYGALASTSFPTFLAQCPLRPEVGASEANHRTFVHSRKAEAPRRHRNHQK